MSTSMYARSANSYLDPDRIRVARMRRGMTKVDLARKLSVTPRTITKYEDGGAPTAGADALAQALGFPVKYFFRGNTPSLRVDEVRFRTAQPTEAVQGTDRRPPPRRLRVV